MYIQCICNILPLATTRATALDAATVYPRPTTREGWPWLDHRTEAALQRTLIDDVEILALLNSDFGQVLQNPGVAAYRLKLTLRRSASAVLGAEPLRFPLPVTRAWMFLEDSEQKADRPWLVPRLAEAEVDVQPRDGVIYGGVWCAVAQARNARGEARFTDLPALVRGIQQAVAELLASTSG